MIATLIYSIMETRIYTDDNMTIEGMKKYGCADITIKDLATQSWDKTLRNNVRRQNWDAMLGHKIGTRHHCIRSYPLV